MDRDPVPYTEDQLKTMMLGYPEGHPLARAGITKSPIDKKKRRAKGKAQRQARRRNR